MCLEYLVCMTAYYYCPHSSINPIQVITQTIIYIKFLRKNNIKIYTIRS